MAFKFDSLFFSCRYDRPLNGLYSFLNKFELDLVYYNKSSFLSVECIFLKSSYLNNETLFSRSDWSFIPKDYWLCPFYWSGKSSSCSTDTSFGLRYELLTIVSDWFRYCLCVWLPWTVRFGLISGNLSYLFYDPPSYPFKALGYLISYLAFNALLASSSNVCFSNNLFEKTVGWSDFILPAWRSLAFILLSYI